MRPASAVRLALALSLLAAGGALAQDGYDDETFSGDGKLLVGWSGDNAEPTAVSALADGALFVGGSIDDGGNQNVAVTKISADGVVDLSWGAFGRRRIALDAVAGQTDDLLRFSLPPDGSLLVAGISTVESNVFYKRLPVIARLTPGGDLDDAFADHGRSVIPMPWATDHWFWEGAVSQGDGRILYFGDCESCPDDAGAVRPMLLRIGLDGAPDPTYSGDGWSVPTAAATTGFYPSEAAFDSQGRLLVLGQKGSDHYVARFTATGDLDTGFGGGAGVVLVPLPAGTNPPYSLAVDPDSGAVYVSMAFASGTYQDYAAVIRLNAAGAVDATFGGDGLAELVFDDRLWVSELEVQSDGRVVGAGLIEHDNTSPPDFFLVRLLSDGTPDTAFHANGVRRVTFGQTPDGNDWARAMTLSGGRLVAVGQVAAPTARQFGVLRTTSALLFADGFERAASTNWLGN